MRALVRLILWVLFAIAVSRAQQSDTSVVDAIKAGPTPYFTAKMENLTSKLSLTPDQQAKLKPIAEQEVNLLEEVRGNSGYTQKEKISRLEKVVLESDKQMKPWLSAEQWEKLQALRKDQKERLKQYAKTTK
jgi:Spy/CpxP family protein refolding chaperone